MSSSFLENRCAASWEGNQRVWRQRIRVAACTSLLLPCLSAKSGSWHSNPIEIRFPSSLLLRPYWDKSRSWHHSPHIESRSRVSFLPWFLGLIGILAFTVRTESDRRLQYWKSGFWRRNVVQTSMTSNVQCKQSRTLFAFTYFTLSQKLSSYHTISSRKARKSLSTLNRFILVA